MASSGWPFNYRFCPLDLFSFSLNPEITSVLWRSSQPYDVEPPLRYYQPSQLFHIILPENREELSLLLTLQYTIVTSGILVVVGLSSICSYKFLQCVRQSTCGTFMQKLRSYLTNPFPFNWHKSKAALADNEKEQFIGNNNFSSRQLYKRPSELQLVSSGSPVAKRLLQKSRDNSLERRLLTKVQTPLADCDIASGEEDINDIQGQYFGPTVKSSTICMELMGSSPENTPTHDTPAGYRRRRANVNEESF